jgi:hypothetical protein
VRKQFSTLKCEANLNTIKKFGFYHTESTSNGCYYASYACYSSEIRSELLFRHLAVIQFLDVPSRCALQNTKITFSQSNKTLPFYQCCLTGICETALIKKKELCLTEKI